MRRIARSVIGLMVLLGAGVASDARAQVCTNTPLPEVSAAVIPANGFPLYYDDANALALTPCLDPAVAGFCGGPAAIVVPNPALPIAFPGNFPVEFPYFSAISTMTLPTGGKALLVHSISGSFFAVAPAAPVPAAGTQLAFSRLRIRIQRLLPFGTYTVTHPYGVETLVANNLGAINVTFDSGIAAPGFFGPLTVGSRVGPSFLQWDAALPPAPAGFIGDGLTPHTITGSPCGTNVFKVEGPLLPAGGVQTPLFVVTGKKIDICGNGILDAGENCDDGNKLAGDCCSPTCKFEPLGSPCTAPTICTNNACNGAGACGSVSLNDGLACTDANVCTVADTCTAGACVGGPRNCVDGNVCTTDLCTPPAVGCENLNNALACDDLNAATAGDSCSGGACMGAIRRATLTLNAGENPSLAGFPAVGDARTDGTRTRVSLINMDPARYPAGCTGVTVKVGGISGTATVTPFAAQAAPLVRATAVNFVANGTVPAGSSVDFRVTCVVRGLQHQTRWAGVVR
jgi:cysteine-rich repeat protein